MVPTEIAEEHTACRHEDNDDGPQSRLAVLYQSCCYGEIGASGWRIGVGERSGEVWYCAMCMLISGVLVFGMLTWPDIDECFVHDG